MIHTHENGKKNLSAFDPKNREDLIVKYAYLVKYIAQKMAKRLPPTVSLDELISAGSLGLIDAIDKYDATKDVSLKTYAQYRIKGAILDELRSMDWYSRGMRKKIQNIEKAIAQVEYRERRPADDIEIAEELDMDLEKYFKMLSDIQGAALLDLDSYIRDKSNDSSNKATFQDQLKGNDDPLKNIHKKELKNALANAIKSISKKEQIVVSLYYYDELTLKEIGKVMSLTESRICQIHTMALIKLKTKFKSIYQN